MAGKIYNWHSEYFCAYGDSEEEKTSRGEGVRKQNPRLQTLETWHQREETWEASFEYNIFYFDRSVKKCYSKLASPTTSILTPSGILWHNSGTNHLESESGSTGLRTQSQQDYLHFRHQSHVSDPQATRIWLATNPGCSHDVLVWAAITNTPQTG